MIHYEFSENIHSGKIQITRSVHKPLLDTKTSHNIMKSFDAMDLVVRR